MMRRDMKQKREMRTNQEQLAEILYDAIKRYINSRNGDKSFDFQQHKSWNRHEFRETRNEHNDKKIQ